MSNINLGRVLLGGLVAGAVLNIGEFLLNGVLLANQMNEVFRKCGLTPPSGRALFLLVAFTFLMGIFLVGVYAALRPGCGPGPKTALGAGLIGWFCVYFYNTAAGVALGFVPINMFFIALAWGLAEYILAAIAGAWLYKEA
ncbi:MAG: hypothetical protein ACREBG_16500 [Pyrinomonadaceae bacterium]